MSVDAPFDQVTWEFIPPPAPPPAPPAPPVQVPLRPFFQWQQPAVTGAVWTWAIGPGASQPNSRPLRELTEARGRQVTFRVDSHPVAQFTIDARSDEIAELGDLDTDLWVWRDGELWFRGRCVTLVDDIDETRHLLQVSAIGYRGMLRRRRIDARTRFDQIDQADIVWELIEASQAKDGGDWGVTRGLAPAGTPRDRPYEPGTWLLDAIERLGRVQGGFEWDISPELVLDIWSPTRGEDTDVVLDWGGVISRVTRSLSPDRFGNSAMALGNEETKPKIEDAADIATDPRGRWEVVEAFPSVSEQSTLDERAPELLEQASLLSAPFTVEFATTQPPDGSSLVGGRSRWPGRDRLWLGDTADLRVESGRLGSYRVRLVEIQATCGDHGTETIRAGLVEVPT